MRPLTLASIVILSSACSTISTSLCERFDECNALADGVSVEECSENWDAAFADMTPSVQTDCQNEINDALDKASCDAFLLSEIPSCPVF